MFIEIRQGCMYNRCDDIGFINISIKMLLFEISYVHSGYSRINFMFIVFIQAMLSV